MTNYIDKAYYKKQTDQASFKFPTIDDFVYDDKMVDYVIESNIKAIRSGKEDVLYHCGSTIIIPDKAKRNQKVNEVSFNYNEEKVNSICNGNYISLFHYHGNFPSYFSKQDHETFKSFVQKGFQDSGIIGVDGLHFKTVLGNTFRVPFTNSYYDRLEKDGSTIIRPVQHVLCDIISYDTISNSKKFKNLFRNLFRQPKLKDKAVRCEITLGENLGKQTILANKAVVEDTQLNNNQYPFRWIDTSYSENNKILPFDFSGKNGLCVYTNSADTKEQILTCFDKKTDL